MKRLRIVLFVGLCVGLALLIKYQKGGETTGEMARSSRLPYVLDTNEKPALALVGEGEVELSKSDSSLDFLIGAHHPTISPDGNTIIVSAPSFEGSKWATDSPDGTYLYSIDLQTSERIPQRIAIGTLPLLSPEGTRLAFASYTGEGELWNIMISDVTGRNQEVAIPGVYVRGYGFGFVWLDENHILYSDPQTTFHILRREKTRPEDRQFPEWPVRKLNVNTGAREDLDMVNVIPEALSPSGELVACVDADARAILLYNPSDGDLDTLRRYRGRSISTDLVWARDGSGLFSVGSHSLMRSGWTKAYASTLSL